MITLSLGDLADYLGAECTGASDTPLLGINTLQDAQVGDVTFLANPSYKHLLATTQASAVIVSAENASECSAPTLICDNPYLAYAKASHLFDDRPSLGEGTHPSATIAKTARLGERVRIGANVVIGEHVHVGDDCQIDANCVVQDHCVLDEHCRLHPNVTLMSNVVMGSYVTLHSGCVIGGDGFGFAPDQGRWHAIAQLGGVRIGNRVSIGCNTCVDRGALNDTIIEDDVIIDNLVQIAHNVHIGRATAMAAMTGIAGSTRVGEGCTFGGASAIAGHITLADHVHLSGRTMVVNDIKEPGQYASSIAHMPVRQWRKSVVRFKQLDDMAKRLQTLEKQLSKD